MPQSTDLMGGGEAWHLAALLGNDPKALTAAGTTQTAATAIPVSNTLISVTASGGATGVILPSNAKIGTPYYISSVGGTAAKVWPAVGQYLNGSQNTGITFSAAVASGVFIQMSLNQWYSFPVAP